MARVAQILDNAVTADAAVESINAVIGAALSWINTYGISESLKKQVDDQEYNYPAIYSSKGNYVELFPDAKKGNFCFWVIDNLELIDYETQRWAANFELICWFDFRNVYTSDYETRSIFNVAKNITDVLEGSVSNIQITVTGVSKENVYAKWEDGFNKETNRQFLKRPYGGFRVDGIITYFKDDLCA